MPYPVRLATPADRPAILSAEDVFDSPPDPALLDEFLADPRHHMTLAFDLGKVVGFASAVHFVHPDKPPQLWINELGVIETHRRRGLAGQLVARVLDHARTLRCTEAWVLADPTPEALGFYDALDARREGTHIAMFTFDLTGTANG